MPKGVGFFPGECQPDGLPAPGSTSKPADGDTIYNHDKIGSRGVAVARFDDLDDPVTEVGTHLGDADGSDFTATGWQFSAEVEQRSRYSRGRETPATVADVNNSIETPHRSADRTNEEPLRFSPVPVVVVH